MLIHARRIPQRHDELDALELATLMVRFMLYLPDLSGTEHVKHNCRRSIVVCIFSSVKTCTESIFLMPRPISANLSSRFDCALAGMS